MDSFSEEQRIDELHQYKILEDDMKEQLNRLTRVACTICDTPISLVNVLDSDRQITKSSKGWDLDEIPREDGFCHHTIQQDDMLIVENAQEDDRFRENRFVQNDPNIQFYAGVPLSTGEGWNLGALSVIDQQPKSLSDEQQEGLKLLAEEVMARFEYKKKESELRQKQQAIQRSLKEKEALLSEIHHRIKNDLSIISGLLQLEIFNTEDHRAKEILQNSQMRIQSMAGVHQMLHSNQEIDRLPFHDFIGKVIDSIRSIYSGDNENIRMEMETDCVTLRFKQAMPCALIINELITNAFKHAFPEGGDGTISVSITREHQQVSLRVQDGGVGLPEDFSLDDTDSIGLMLIHTLVDQLNGEIAIDSTNGMDVEVRFEKEGRREP